MPWMCLERCGANSSQIQQDLQSIVQYKVTRVAFEMYNLGPNGQLLLNNLTQVNTFLTSHGINTYPMISSYPYPPQFLNWMRQLFNNSADGQAFIKQCIETAQENKFSGWNVDWEPVSGDGAPNATTQDAIDYANFLDAFAVALHAEDLELTVDIASWSPLWNWTLIAQSNVDKLMLMNTYTWNFDTFKSNLLLAVQEIGVDKLGVGLETINEKTNQPFSTGELKPRFDLLYQVGAQEIDIWDMPIYDSMWPFITAWQQS